MLDFLEGGTYIFTPLGLPAAITAAVALAAGAIVLIRERASLLSIHFFVITVAVALWLAAFSLMYAATTEEVALVWGRIGFVGVTCIPPAIYHFVVTLLNRQRKLLPFIAINWVVSALMAVAIVSTDAIVPRVERFFWGFHARAGWASVPYLTFFIVILVASLALVLRPGNLPDRERQRVMRVAVSLGIGYLALIDYAPYFGIPIYPIGYLPVLGFIMGIGYVVSRDELVEITAQFAAASILETTRGAVLVTDTGGVVRLVSDSACALLGYNEHELVGKELSAIDSTLAGEVNESGRMPEDSVLFRDRETLWAGRSGELVDVSVTAAFIGDDQGRLMGVVWSAEDIRWKKKEEALRRSEAKYRALVESMNEGVMVLDNAHRIQFVNERLCEILGAGAEDLLQKPVDDVVNRHQFPTVAEVPRRDTLELTRPTGESIWCDVSTAPLFDERGSVSGSIAIYSDITDRRIAELTVRESEALYRLLAEHATDMICRMTPAGVFVYVSPAAMALLGYTPEELIGRSAAELIAADDLPAVRDHRLALLKGMARDALPYRMTRKDGRVVWTETTFQAVRGADGHVTELIAVSRDITARKEAEEQIEHQAYHDMLTGLPNRRMLEDRLTITLARMRRNITRNLPACAAVMFIDLDRFKFVNDTLGHAAGDELLKATARRLADTLRAEDTVARFGGDEFIVLLPDIGEPKNAAIVAAKLLKVISAPVATASEEIIVTGAIGIAIFPSDGDTPETLLKNADAAMYHAKQRSRNSFATWSSDSIDRSHRFTIESGLRRAVEAQQLTLVYQPLLDPIAGRVTGVEALLRWRHPTLGVVPPDEFIRIAEETGLIVEMGRWVVTEAARQVCEWRAAGISVGRMAVNVSSVEFAHADFAESLLQIVESAGLPHRQLEIEITETAVMRDPPGIQRILHNLRQRGITIALDDFGTGNSSLTHLRTFPIDRVKIDRSFVRDLTDEPSDAAIVEAVVRLARALGILVTAEGVETSQQLDILTRLGCTEVQGYFFSPPQSAEALAPLLREGVSPFKPQA